MSLPNVLIIGSGEYVSGIVSSDGAASSSDKSRGVVALVMFDLRARKKIGTRIAIAGTCGLKFPHIRQHFTSAIAGTYRDMDVSFESFPADDVAKKNDAYLDAIATFTAGDLAIIFTPDDSHFDIAKACIERGMHVCVTKPLVHALQQHRELAAMALQRGVMTYVEVHKRWDPIYIDARARLRSFGDFSFFQSFMSQPKKQLKTFAGWAGVSSDISFYLNSHHVDYHCWCMQGIATPVNVSAMASTGVANAALCRDCADSITLMVQWRNVATGNLGAAVCAPHLSHLKCIPFLNFVCVDTLRHGPPAPATCTGAQPLCRSVRKSHHVRSQQRFFYSGHNGDITVDQAHRGYSVATEDSAFASCNPLFFKYTPDDCGLFSGRHCYGYVTFEKFVDAACDVREGRCLPSSFSATLPTFDATVMVTAILEAGRVSLSRGGALVSIE